MAVTTLTSKGQIVIPASIRTRYGLTPGTQVEFVDEGGFLRLVVRRQKKSSDSVSGYGMIKVAKRPDGKPRRLSEFDPALLMKA